MRPIKPEGTGFRKKRSINVDRESEEDDYDYPVSKYINTKKKKPAVAIGSQKTFLLTNDLCKKILTESSLIRSSIETSKKSSYEYERGGYDYVQRITELEE